MGTTTEDRVGVITGASGGIGAAVATSLCEAGWRLVLSARSPEKLAQMVHRMGDQAVAVAGDLRDESLPQRMLDAAVDKFGRCNNAGILEVGPIATIDLARVSEMVRVNVEGAFRVAYVFLKHFRAEGAGHLINVSSVLGKKVRPTAGAYAATKYAIEALSEALRMELSKTDVQVSCIEPGLVMSGLHDRWEVHPSELMGIPEPLQPSDIARMVLFLLNQPPHVRLPQLMILPKGHEI